MWTIHSGYANESAAEVIASICRMGGKYREVKVVTDDNLKLYAIDQFTSRKYVVIVKEGKDETVK
jgi:hypothetical protein